VNDGWYFPLPHADFGILRVSDHSALGHGACEEDRRTNRVRVEKGEGATEFSPPLSGGAVGAHPKIAEARWREGEIPTVIHQRMLVLLYSRPDLRVPTTSCWEGKPRGGGKSDKAPANMLARPLAVLARVALWAGLSRAFVQVGGCVDRACDAPGPPLSP